MHLWMLLDVQIKQSAIQKIISFAFLESFSK